MSLRGKQRSDSPLHDCIIPYGDLILDEYTALEIPTHTGEGQLCGVVGAVAITL